MNDWYLIQIKSNSYKIAERNLNRQGFKTFMPLLEKTNKGRSKFTNYIKPLFPGYMFVGSEHHIDWWRKINNTLGVSRLLSYGGEPKALPEELISSLISRCDKFGLLIKSKTPAIGDSIMLMKGAFTDLVATIETIDEKERIWVIMELMGRHTRIQLTTELL